MSRLQDSPAVVLPDGALDVEAEGGLHANKGGEDEARV